MGKKEKKTFDVEIVRYEKVRYSYFTKVEARDEAEAEELGKEEARKINDFEIDFPYDRCESETTSDNNGIAEVGTILPPIKEICT